MARGRKGSRSSRHGDDDEHEREQDLGPTGGEKGKNKPPADFAQRRELQRKAAAEKRRSKMKCHLCGQTGHIRRECPGIDDDGAGMSKFTKSKGDPGALILKSKGSGSGKYGNSKKKGSRNRGRKLSRGGDDAEAAEELALPAGFTPAEICKEGVAEKSEEAEGGSFFYFDASCDPAVTIDYLRNGRSLKAKLSRKDAMNEYQSALERAAEVSNFGGCLARSCVKPGRPWAPAEEESFPKLGQSGHAGRMRYVVGIGSEVRCCGNDGKEGGAANAEEKSEEEPVEDSAATALLVDTIADERVAGVYCDLDFSPNVLSRAGRGREAQLRRLRAVCRAAGQANVPVQVRTSPPASSSIPQSDSNSVEEKRGGKRVTPTAEREDPYSEVIADLGRVLLEVTASYPSLIVHLSCWSGRADHMVALLQTYPDNIWVGLDATVSFGKAVIAHECAFDVPLDKLLLETGGPNTIPAEVASAMGREAFCHSGLLPYVAEAVARRRSSDAVEVTAEEVARAAAVNTARLYD